MHRYTCKICGHKTKKAQKHLRKMHLDEYGQLVKKKLNNNHFFTVEKLHVWQPLPPPRQILMQILEKDCQTYSFVWDDIQFKERQLQIYINRLDKRFLPIDCKNATESLNKIKEEFFRRFHGPKLYKLKAKDNKIMLNWSKDVLDILDLVNAMVDFYSFKFDKTRKTRQLKQESLDKLSNDEIIQFFKIKSDKEPYIRFLFNKHDAESKLVPILESIGTTHEESFLFRIPDAFGQHLVVWENLNPARATYIFRIKETSSKFKSILKYIAEQEQAKRSFLRNKLNHSWANNTLGFVCYIEHDDFYSYEIKVKNLIRYQFS